MLGDFNAQTVNENDFVSIKQNAHAENDNSEFLDDYTSHLEDITMTVCRKSKDNLKPRYVNLLLNFCRGRNMYILNGRAGNDKRICEFTRRNESIVD